MLDRLLTVKIKASFEAELNLARELNLNDTVEYLAATVFQDHLTEQDKQQVLYIANTKMYGEFERPKCLQLVIDTYYKDVTYYDEERVTVFYTGEFFGNIVAHEGKLHQTGKGKYAQYDKAPYVDMTPKRKRTARRFRQTYRPYIVVLKGWNHPKPDEILNHYKTIKEDKTVCVKQSIYTSFSGEYTSDFDKAFNEYITNNKVEVLFDVREV